MNYRIRPCIDLGSHLVAPPTNALTYCLNACAAKRRADRGAKIGILTRENQTLDLQKQLLGIGCNVKTIAARFSVAVLIDGPTKRIRGLDGLISESECPVGLKQSVQYRSALRL
jgi:hypothetical protein